MQRTATDATELTPAGSGPPTRRFYGWRIVTALAITETVSWGILYYAFTVFQVPMREELGASAATMAGAFSVAMLVTGVAAVPVGRWLDRHGARGLMTAGSVGAVVLVIAWSRVQTVLQLYLVFAGIGLVSAAVLYEPAFAVVVRWFDRDRARALLAITVVAGFASTIFLPVSDALINALGWRDALLALAGVLASITIPLHLVVLRRRPADVGQHPDGSPASLTAHATRKQPHGRLRDTTRWALRDPLFGWLTLAFAANTLAVIVVAVHLVPYLREQGHSSAFAAAAVGSLGALSVSGRLIVTRAMRRWRTATLTAAAFGLQGLAVVVLLVAGATTAGAVAFVVMFGLGFGVGTIARPTLIASAYGAADYATLAALGGVASTVAKTIGPIAAGLARTVSGSYTPMLIGLLLVCTIAAHAAARCGASLDRRTHLRT